VAEQQRRVVAWVTISMDGTKWVAAIAIAWRKRSVRKG
jgi:hypothetical protein